ncbi:sensor domain-containing diguanylate cyclase [uncultured Ruminococcus sp.]|uniref:sensor domain-containing diguanylate cyclase n=1 Tax=uncultured Ruminococcus sp. TaxID=165186 RepID=UPI0025E537B3|nr:sensor domain-containing diguanylate cyclase [uncultured Ruminococcus sp.]
MMVLTEQEKKDMLEEIYKIGEKLYAQMGKDTDEGHMAVFNYLTELGRTLVGADRASFWKWDKEKHELWTASATNVDKIVIPDDKGLVGKALKEKRVIITNSPYSDPDFNQEVDKQTGYLTMSVLVMPVADISGEYIGAFQIINKLGEEGFNAEEDIKKLSLAAFVCGIALESETFYKESHYDKLTGLRNRMGFYSDFSHKYAAYLKPSNIKPLTMIMCDLDKYKKVNDNFGHNAGDAALRYIGDIMRRHAGENDTVYRWGGDEFIMVLGDTDLKKAGEIAEAIRSDIKENTFKVDGIPVNLSMSFGCTLYNIDKTIEENIAKADDNMFVAKDSGRNQVYSE